MSMNNDVISRLEGIMGAIESSRGPKSEDKLASAKDQNIFGYMADSFGGFSVAMGAIKTATACATKLFPDNEKYQRVVRIAEGTIPVAMTVNKIWDAAKRYINNRKPPKKYVDKEKVFFGHMLDVDEEVSYLERRFEYDADRDNVPMSPVEEWMLTMPNGKSIETVVVIDSKYDIVEDLSKLPIMGMYYVVYMIGGKIPIALKIDKDFLGRTREIKMMYDGKYKYASIQMLCCYAYIESLDFKENVITFKGPREIEVSPRHKVEHRVYQMKDYMFKEIRKSMEKRKKRCYALVGSPGTGKTTIVNKIVDEMRDVPAIYIPCSIGNDNKGKMAWALLMSRMISPCIVILEDIDSLPLQHKHSEYLDLFIEYLDAAKYDNPVTYLVTLNEPEQVHESLMDRRGRFDRLMLVTPPKERSEVDEVMGNVYMREMGKKMPKGLLSEEFYEIARGAELRQSDFAEIVNRVKINDMPLSPSSFTETIKDICDSQELINRFKERKAAKNKVSSTCDNPVGSSSCMSMSSDSRSVATLVADTIGGTVEEDGICEKEVPIMDETYYDGEGCSVESGISI